MDILHKMISIASEKYEGTRDKMGMPFILHPLWVMVMMSKAYPDIDLLCIAVGQNLLDKTNTTKEEIVSFGFNQRVVDGIVALTKNDNETYKDYKQKILNNKDAMRVKFYDLTHNMDMRRIKNPNEQDFLDFKKNKIFREEIRIELADERLILSPQLV